MIDKDYTIPDSTDTELIKYIWDGDNWKYNKTFNRRRLDTIYFHKKNYVSQELDKFLNNETTRKFYEKLDIPYKKIFLFYGIPGTGKSSFIRALASEYKYKLCIVKNIKNMDDSGLEDMINSIRQKSFLVFEDIDSMFIKREAQTRGNFITFSGILNILDGISTYSKLVVFITTNFINQIDSAIKRRVDVAVEFTYLRKAEILEMIKQFFPDNDIGEQIYEQLKFKNITANALEKFFIHCIQKNEDVLKNIQFLDDYIYFSSNEQPPDSMYS
jgi:chaperone BCS1